MMRLVPRPLPYYLWCLILFGPTTANWTNQRKISNNENFGSTVAADAAVTNDWDQWESIPVTGDITDDQQTWSAIRRSLDEWRIRTKLAGKNRKKREKVSICYDGFGCFRDQGPFDYLDTLPASPESIGTTFTLHTRRNGADGEPLFFDGQLLTNGTSFNSTNDIKIIIHGFGSSSKRPWVVQMTEVLLGLDDFNIINVDWQNGSKLPNYVQAAANTQLVGKQIAKLIEAIDRRYQVPPSRYHLIGFSLGAHVAGFTGQQVPNISRITGLDPASPLFEGYAPDARLDPSDARFVDVIHSNGDSFFRGGLGSYEPMGTVDFYPNGGRVQLGCSSTLGALTNMLYHGRQWNLLCNHRRAFRFFIDSVQPHCTFRAFSCSSYEEYLRGQCFDCGPRGRQCSNMGYYSHLSQGRGAMYLATRDKEPFCVNQFRVQIRFAAKQGVTWGSLQLQLADGYGLNETFTLTQEVDQLKEMQRFQTLIVAHPQLNNLTEVTLTYTRYRGWIYHGKNEWIIDRVELLDSNFIIKTYCQPGTMLADTIPVRLKLHSVNCTLGPGYEENDDTGILDNREPDTTLATPELASAIADESQETPIIHFQPATAHRYFYHHPVAEPGRFVLPLPPPPLPSSISETESPVGIELLERRRPARPPPVRLTVMARPVVSVDPPSPGGVSSQQQQQQQQPQQQVQARARATGAAESNLATTVSSLLSQTDDQSGNSESGIITPILNTASKMFWRLWNGATPTANQTTMPTTATTESSNDKSLITSDPNVDSHYALVVPTSGTRQGRWLPSDHHHHHHHHIIRNSNRKHHRLVLVIQPPSISSWNGGRPVVVGYQQPPPPPPPPSPPLPRIATTDRA